MSETTSERDTHFQGFARKLWEEMLSQTEWHGIDVRGGYSPLHHPEDEEHKIYIDLIARRVYDLLFSAYEAHPGEIEMSQWGGPSDEEIHQHIAGIPDMTKWPEES